MPTPLSAQPIRRLTMSDLQSCADLAEDRDWAREEHKWGLLLAASTAYGIDDPTGDGLAAVCVVTSYGPTDRPELAAIGMMLVAGRHARQGLGRRLMNHALHEAGDTPLTLYATPLGRPLYEKLGFTDIGEVETLLGHLRSPEHPPRVATRPAAAGDLPALVRLDTEVFGADRTHLIARLPAFADRLRVAEEGSTLIGYAAVWPTPAADVIGPLIARDTETAKALISSLADGSERPVRTVIDLRHKELLNWLKDHDLKPVTLTTLMTYGGRDLPGDRSRRFAPLNMATG
ncbi:histone acetyltransferase HPA2 [Streptomyces sp. L-9-10]|uniref:GNAT family N-acetyltransferase n=1 Tax=Streptomyces sp. L-9-10 TaxID=1478131 RepID=UPI00101C22E2|nr:GNAT family N-acetyltransferase [Streptomyces sp. L-9-10]RYJ30373.1 histone acetyltransferase HPA2 [Streptomyces sp. L-9-10]